MTIKEALKKMKPGQKLSSSSAGFILQSKDNLLYWILEAPKSKTNGMTRMDNYIDIRKAKDWKITGEAK